MSADFCWLPPDDQAQPASPPFRSLEGARTREAYLSAVEQFRVEEAPRYRAGTVRGLHLPDSASAGFTWCNLFVADVTAAMDAPVPKQLANDMATWLVTRGPKRRWVPVTAAKALELAEAGCPVVAVQPNPGGHGHVAMVVPAPAVEGVSQLRISQAGARNFSNGPIRAGFGAGPVSFFAHP